MTRTLIILALAVVSISTAASTASAQKGKKGGGVKVRINTGFNHNKFKHFGNKNFHHNKFNHNKYYHNKFNHNKFKHANFKNVKYGYKYQNVNQRYFYNLKYYKWSKFPYRVCVYNNAYWVLYGNQWMPYHYLVQNHAGAWNWHNQHFHKIKHHKRVNVNLYKFKK